MINGPDVVGPVRLVDTALVHGKLRKVGGVASYIDNVVIGGVAEPNDPCPVAELFPLRPDGNGDGATILEGFNGEVLLTAIQE